ncbi:MAG: hypothetical protein BGO12_20850 [Verrucomicrobia bacterium 61-8]|nr:MAG: hypothetical protein BGO12_20850 [Verrucomicrobia bacterium 61-8]
MTGNWFGVRDTLEDHGLKLGGKWTGDFYGVVDSQRGSRGFFDQELKFTGELDFAKLFNVDALEGLKGFGEVRWRDSRANSNPNNFVQAQSNFQPSHFQSGTQWRMMTFGLEYSTPEILGMKEFLTLRGGWLQPQKEFIDQPLSKLFVNNSFESSKGIGANIPFSSSFSTWGGTLKLKPVSWYYAKAGLFMSYPNATASSNHGLAFEGFAEDPNQNGLLVMGETGFTPKIGAAQLPGKYAFGGYYYEQENTSYFGQNYPGRYGFYWQMDQMLFREPSPEAPALLGKGPSDGKSVADAKSFKSPVSTEKPKLSNEGLNFFSLVTFAPKYNNVLPFYFQAGLVYTGLIPTRNDDLTMFAIGYGSYSFYNIQALQESGNVNQPNYSMVLEWDYRLQINKWAYVQPFAQYIVKPAGTGAIENATVLGVQTGVVF